MAANSGVERDDNCGNAIFQREVIFLLSVGFRVVFYSNVYFLIF